MKRIKRYITLIVTLLLLGSMVSEAWAYKVTYHVLTLPIDASSAEMVSAVDGKRLEAIRVVVDNAATIELPAHFKSPLATDFQYWAADQVGASAATELYSGSSRVKEVIYTLDTSTATETTEGTSVDSNCDIYVTYDYNSSNTIADLSGSTTYVIGATYGFLALNRGRNNRPAVVPRAKVTEDCLTSEDFVKIDNPGSGITTYWNSGDNKNARADVESQFFFQFKLEGSDPYNIAIRTAYNRDITYIEKNEGTNNFVYKWYKESRLFASGSNNGFLASDINKKYTTAWVSGSANPTDPDSESSAGYFHGTNAPIWSSFALLNNTTSTGYVFMGSRTYNTNGTFNATTGSNNSYNYNYLKLDNNNLTINKVSPADATKKYSVDATFYEIRDVRFNVKTPFGHTVSASVKMSDYKILNDDISIGDIPTSLERKYCTFTKFYKDAALTQEITKYSQMTGTDVYVGYEVQNTPFEAIASDASYTTATWYELTDAGSTQEYGRKIKNNSGTYKNNGASGVYDKESEFAFIGDPYELKVLYREGSEDAVANTYVTLSTYNTWDIPADDEEEGFLLRKYGDTGYWNWNTGQPTGAVTYGTNLAQAAGKEAQTITFTVSGLNGSKYFKVTTGGTDVAQIVSVTPTVGSVEAETGSSATVSVRLAENAGASNKTMTVTIQEYSDADGETASGTASVITITQGIATSSFAGNTVEYSTSASTRVKVLELPKKTFTYKIVDKSGRIAVTATASQTIFSKLSLASVPSIIVSPFIIDETITFYSSFDSGSGAGTGTSRTHLSTVITETPNADAPIYVKYTTTHLPNKPFKLSEDQTIFVRLNGQYIYYEGGSVKSSSGSEEDDKYRWKLRGQDPYAMLLDNLGARTALSATGSESVAVPTDDDGTTASQSRQVGAWVKLAAAVGNDVALTFDKVRANAQPFIAKSSARAGVYEVMVATGDGVDASDTYYNIGRPEANTVKIYSNVTYQAGDDEEIKFRLEENQGFVYHLIDKAKHELLRVENKSPELVLPAEYQSPLVGAANYSYYAPDNITISGTTYTPTDPAIKLSSLSGLDATYSKTSGDYNSAWTAADETHKLTAVNETDVDAQAKKLAATGDYYYRIGETSTYYHVNVTKSCYHDIYVTYVKNDLVTFNSTGSPYMLRFLNPYAAGYYLEDGKDKLTSEQIQAVYPYCNGDGNLNIYGTEMNEEQMNGGANTRPRWIWYFDCPTGYADDPYHVTIRSRSTISYNGVSNNTYLKTYAVHFNQDADPATKHIVTGGSLPGIASEEPTEYMILGAEGNYRLMTTESIDDGITNERRSVTSLEQYWKTYNMIRLDVLGLAKATENGFSDDPATFVVPDDPFTAYNKDHDPDLTYREYLYQVKNWHSYDAYANATRWNGFNDVEGKSGLEKKKVEQLEHWFQTFDMGNGAFDIEDANIPPVLVLLDRHGWEIMRKPLPTTTYPYGDELDALRAYDSPMVKEYHFFNNATKASGCHKYSLRIQNNALRDAIKDGGTEYTSTSLAALPPITASGVKDGNGFIQDFYVTYTVKEEYEKSYDYSFTDNGDGTFTETGTPSKFLVLQNDRFLKKENDREKNRYYFSKPIWEHTNPTGGNVYDLILSPQNNTVAILDGSGNISNDNFWYIGPNLDIDKEMGFKWTLAGTTEYDTKKTYANTSKVDYMQTTGFDPYNLQIKNAGTNKYITTHITSAALVGGAMVGSYNHDADTDTTNVTLKEGFSFGDVDPNVSTGSEGHDHTNLKISNQTFMAVSDANGNMQLMPRFDHTLRVNTEKTSPYQTSLQEPKLNAQTASVDDNNSMNAQTTFLIRPQIVEYLIIDNQGREALRYKRAGEYYPAITEHFKSPLATNFRFYKTLTDSNNDGVYEMETLADEITGSFAEAGLDDDNDIVYVRYDYNENYDVDGENILQGKWFTIKLNDLDVQANGTVNTSDGTGVSLFADAISPASPTKPATIDENDKTWQWKFLRAPSDPSSAYYEAPDPYAIELYNRYANYSATSAEPNPMSVPIKVNGKDRFSLLSHPDGGYALAVNGLGTYNYSFLNGAAMTTSVAATTTAENRQKITVADEAAYTSAKAALSVDGEYYYKYGNGDEPRTYSYRKVTRANGDTDAGVACSDDDWTNGDQYNFTVKTNALSPGAKLLINDDVTHNYTYRVITNGNKLAASATQTGEEASVRNNAPYLPAEIQTPLLNDETDYLYYGSATIDDNSTPADLSDDTYTMVTATKLFTLYGLYEDLVYVRYNAYNAETTPYFVPNVKAVDGSGKVARGSGSNDVAMSISGDLPYNIIWENDNMMVSSDNDAISDGGNHALAGTTPYVWYFTGEDPYALKIKHMGGKYADGSTTLVTEASAKDFMLLKKTGYDYGILAETGNQNTKLSGYGGATTTGDPTKFIIFGLSVHKLYYHLIIAKSCPNQTADPLRTDQYVDIPYMETESGTLTTKRIYGTTQRDLTSVNAGEGTHYAGEKYQLGETINWYDAEAKSVIGHTYSYDAGTVSIGDALEVPSVFYRANCTFDHYIEGIYSTDGSAADATLNAKYKGLKQEILMADADLIGKTVVVNIVYQFDKSVATNTGLGFVTSTDQNLWYTLEALNAGTPYLARYTNSQGLKMVAGRETRYTNDYLFTPVGDVYGFKMFNRYFLKNSNPSGDDYTKMMTTSSLAADAEVAIGTPANGYEVYELTAGDNPGYFRMHPVANNSGTQYYVNMVGNDLKLGTTPSEWMWGLDVGMLQPYFMSAGNVGGLTKTPKAGREKSGETLYEEALETGKVTALQAVVYDDDNIVDFTDGYYRLHSQPGIPGISPVRYASGYLHDTERTAVSGGIPMHFYSKVGVTGTFAGETYPLTSGFTVTNATRGDIPVPATEADPSTIFHAVSGSAIANRTLTNVTLSTQGLNIKENKMGTATGTTFRLIDIGGGVVILFEPSSSNYFNFTQTGNIYDLKYSTATADRLDDVKWCMEPAASQGLKVTMNDGGDDHYYATFYAPFDVLLPSDDGDKKYDAYISTEWGTTCIYPKKVPAVGETYAEGKFVPAGTPVILRTTDTSGSITLTLPNNSPAPSPLSCVFSGEYLEKMLAADASNDVYTFGLPFTSTVTIDRADGSITAPLLTQDNTHIGFYINATPNKEANSLESLWTRNNRYVLHNKVYYRSSGESPAPQTRSIDFVPVDFGDEEPEIEENAEENDLRYAGIYDLQGRKVAELQNSDAPFKHLAPGMYIVNGKKVLIR
ncbi:MAG: hypothetical protein IJP70_04205 [Bacteroidales bacterium]|nr:hypothetical protein [Bacteroidales bacterium]